MLLEIHLLENAFTGIFYLDYYVKIIHTPSHSVTCQRIVMLMLELEQTTFEELAQEASSVEDIIPLGIAQL